MRRDVYLLTPRAHQICQFDLGLSFFFTPDPSYGRWGTPYI